jgi:signal transduction histidine kinase
VTRGTQRSLPSLKTELLLNVGLLTAAALTLAVATALVAQVFETRVAVAVLLLLIVADVFVVFLFGRHLVERLVLRPMERLMSAVDALASGDLAQRAPVIDNREFAQLADHFNVMTDRLLDAQRQLVRTEKMATLGLLAAGIAHEVGNPLAAIGTSLDVLERRGCDRELLRSVRRETERIDRIVRGLLAYARPREEDLGEVDVGVVIRGVVDLLTQQGSLKGLDVALELGTGLPRVRGRPHALEQVLINLMLNGADAAPGGRLVVGAASWQFQPRAAGRRRCDEYPAEHGGTADATGPASRRLNVLASRRPWRPELPNGTPGVLVWVGDSGPGVPAADRERVFDPFFTTKPPGRGTGLGLAIAQRTIYEWGGVVWVDDAREGGAAFKIFLPAVRGG